VVEPFPEVIYGEVPNELNELPNEAGPKFRPTLDEKEFSMGVMGFGVVDIDDNPLLPYIEFSLLGPGKFWASGFWYIGIACWRL
jgi:hypothetical protein